MQRIALVGAGFIGSVHAAALAAHPDVDLVLVHDVDADRAEAVAARHGSRAATRLEEVFDGEHVDAVLIASSTDTHTEHLRRAADAGVAVLCEKPIDGDLARAVDAVEHVEASGVPAMVGFNRRFDRANVELKRVVDAGEVGEVELVQMTNRGPVSPPLEYVAVSGGQLRDQTVHFFDLTRWLTGQDPVEVHVLGSALADPRITRYGDVDTSVAVLRLPTGAVVQIDSVRRTGYGYDERVEVMGSTGLAQAAAQRTGSVTRFGGTEAVSAGLHAGWFERVQPTYAASLAGFVAALEAGTPVPVTLRDGLRAQAIAEAATVSLRSGRTEEIRYP